MGTHQIKANLGAYNDVGISIMERLAQLSTFRLRLRELSEASVAEASAASDAQAAAGSPCIPDCNLGGCALGASTLWRPVAPTIVEESPRWTSRSSRSSLSSPRWG